MQKQRLNSPIRRPKSVNNNNNNTNNIPDQLNGSFNASMSPSPSINYSNNNTSPSNVPDNKLTKAAKASRRGSNTNSLISVLKNSTTIAQGDPSMPCNCSPGCSCRQQQQAYGSTNTSSSSPNDTPNLIPTSTLPFVGTSNPISMSIPHVRVHNDDLTWKAKIPYYVPCYSWIPNYSFENMLHDFMAGLSLASYQIPLSMSFASAVAKVPPICGLLGLSIAPLIYCFLGSVPQLIVGPEAAVSMIIGQAIEKTMKHNTNPDIEAIDVLSVLTFSSGAILLGFGLGRLGYIDNVLCGSLLRGFITAIGFSMILNSLISILGLDSVLNAVPAEEHYHSIYEKLKFLYRYGENYHIPSTIIGILTFIILLILRQLKNKLAKHKYKKVSFVPEILMVVVITTIFSYHFKFHKKLGISIVGNISAKGFQLRSPFASKLQTYYSDLFTVSLMAAILGFFESSTASKSLSSNLEMPISSNRELVALGSVGLVLSCFGSLPSFGGYGRSKLNAMNGARTPMAGAFMGLTTLFVTLFMLHYLHHLPICVLNAIIASIGLSLIQETPSDLKFHIRTRGYNELITFFVTLAASVYYSVEIGVALGVSYSIIRVIKHSTKSRIQILARVPGTATFVNADYDENAIGISDVTLQPHSITVKGYSDLINSHKYKGVSTDGTGSATTVPVIPAPIPASSETTPLTNSTNTELEMDPNISLELNMKLNHTKLHSLPPLEDIEGCLIIKISEPLTFTNTNDLKSRLKRIELFGSAEVHPAIAKKSRSIRHVVFDLHGMTSVDSSAAQILHEIVVGYQSRGINVFFCRVNTMNNNLKERLVNSGIYELLQDTKGENFGVVQKSPPYYDEILDALSAIVELESTCSFDDVYSRFSDYVY